VATARSLLDSMKGNPQARWLMLGLSSAVLIALGLRVYYAIYMPVWLDEALSWRLASMDWTEMWYRLQETGTVHPPLYFALLRLQMALLGDNPWALRWLSVICGTLLVPAAYWFALECLRSAGRGVSAHGQSLPVGVGMLAAWLVALNPMQIHLCCQARGYALALFLVVATSSLVLRALRETRHVWLLWSAYVLLTLAAWYTHYLTMLSSAVQWLYALAVLLIPKCYLFTGTVSTSDPSQPQPVCGWKLTGLGVSVLTVIAGFIPWASICWTQLSHARVAWHRPLMPAELTGEWGRALAGSFFDPPHFELNVLDIGVVLVVALASVWAVLRVRPAGYLLLLQAWLPPVLLGIVSWLSPRNVYSARYFFAAEFTWIILLAMLILDSVWQWERWIISLVALILMTIALATRSDWQYLGKSVGMAAVRDYIAEQWQDGDIVLAENPADFLVARYYFRACEIPVYLYGTSSSRQGYRGRTHLLDDDLCTREQLVQWRPQRIWYLRSGAYGVFPRLDLPEPWKNQETRAFARPFYLEGPLYLTRYRRQDK